MRSSLLDTLTLIDTPVFWNSISDTEVADAKMRTASLWHIMLPQRSWWLGHAQSGKEQIDLG